ncbi:VOC family protein [Streptomyces sp. NPDC047706]|uniref:VOC family protein n=1 Tax=Streptomyces sp. NPDC047706 TaxID=3365486 RepID=UPI003717916A
MAGEPSFFEIGVADPERGRAFYGALFGWNLEAGPGGDGFTIGTGGLPGGMHGGGENASPYLFFRVDDMDAAMVRVRELGGSVEDIGEGGQEDPDSVARFGRFTLCRDDQGSPFGLHQPPWA